MIARRVSELLGADQHGHVVLEPIEHKQYLRVVQERVRAQPGAGSELPDPVR